MAPYKHEIFQQFEFFEMTIFLNGVLLFKFAITGLYLSLIAQKSWKFKGFFEVDINLQVSPVNI